MDKHKKPLMARSELEGHLVSLDTRGHLNVGILS